MARQFQELDWFILHSDIIDTISSELYSNFMKHLMTAISSDKFPFVFGPLKNLESPLETLIRHCRRHQLEASAGRLYSNLYRHHPTN